MLTLDTDREVALRATSLVKDYKRGRAVDGVDLTVGVGERVALLGPNGAGKTTTLLMCLGAVTPDAGDGRLQVLRRPDQAAHEGLERFGIPGLARAMGTELSSGQKTLVGIVKAAMHRPRLMVLDEPTASLDPDVAMRVRTGLRGICDEFATALLVTEPQHGRGRAAL